MRRGKTAMPVKTLKEIGRKLTETPKDFEAHKTIQRFLENRRKMIDTGEGIDWSTAEALAFGAILLDGNPIRLSGQDSERGTFSQRHSVLYDQKDENRYIPLNTCRPPRLTTRSSIRCSRRRPCSASNTATAWRSRRR